MTTDLINETTTETKPAKAAKTAAVQAAPEVPALKRVIIQRSAGETDSHAFIGYNDFVRQVKYDEPVEMPVDVIAHLRSCKRVEYRADDKGRPVPSYSAMYNVIDA